MPEASVKPSRRTKETPLIQSLDRGLQILEAVGKSAVPVSLGQLTGVLGIDRSSVFRLANTLKRRGFLSSPAAGKDYVLGSSVWRLSRQYDWSGMLAAVAHGQLRNLANVTEETAHLAVRDGRNALFVDHAASTNHVIAVSGQTGERVPLYCTSHGKALLADFDEAELKQLLGSKPLAQHTKNTLKTVAELAKICAEIRARGFASDNSEFLEGVRCIAAPIRDKAGAVVASIGISAPSNRLPADRHPAIANHVMRVAAQVSGML